MAFPIIGVALRVAGQAVVNGARIGFQVATQMAREVVRESARFVRTTSKQARKTKKTLDRANKTYKKVHSLTKHRERRRQHVEKSPAYNSNNPEAGYAPRSAEDVFAQSVGYISIDDYEKATKELLFAGLFMFGAFLTAETARAHKVPTRKLNKSDLDKLYAHLFKHAEGESTQPIHDKDYTPLTPSPFIFNKQKALSMPHRQLTQTEINAWVKDLFNFPEVGAFTQMIQGKDGSLYTMTPFEGQVTNKYAKIVLSNNDRIIYSKSDHQGYKLGTRGRGWCTSGPQGWYEQLGKVTAPDGKTYDFTKMHFWKPTGRLKDGSITRESTYDDLGCGFVEVAHGTPQWANSLNASNGLRPGDVMTLYTGTGGGHHGMHGMMWDGEHWRSDYVQAHAWPSTYKHDMGDKSAYLWRHPLLQEERYANDIKGMQPYTADRYDPLAQMQWTSGKIDPTHKQIIGTLSKAEVDARVAGIDTRIDGLWTGGLAKYKESAGGDAGKANNNPGNIKASSKNAFADSTTKVKDGTGGNYVYFANTILGYAGLAWRLLTYISGMHRGLRKNPTMEELVFMYVHGTGVDHNSAWYTRTTRIGKDGKVYEAVPGRKQIANRCDLLGITPTTVLHADLRTLIRLTAVMAIMDSGMFKKDECVKGCALAWATWINNGREVEGDTYQSARTPASVTTKRVNYITAPRQKNATYADKLINAIPT